MSLVNDLLEDFHRRRITPDIAPENPLANIEISPRELAFKQRGTARSQFSSTGRVVVGLVALTCIAVIALEVVHRFGSESEADTTPSVSARPPFPLVGNDEALLSDVEAPYATPLPNDSGGESGANIEGQSWGELTGISIEPEADHTRVRIFLSRESDYWIQGDPSNGEIEVVITRTRLSKPFPPDSFITSGLSLQEAHNSSIGLHLLLTVESGAFVQSQFVNDGFNPQLILDVLTDEASASLTIEDLPDETTAATTLEENALETSWGTITRSRPAMVATKSEAHRSLDRARELFAQDRPREAVAEYIRALSFEPGLHRAREALVGLLIESGQLSAAERHLTVGLQSAPSHSEYTLLHAQLLAAMKQPDRAIAILESLPLPTHRRSDSLNLLAALYQQKGEHSRAEELFRSAVSIAPHEARLWMGLGISLEGQRREIEALGVYKQAESLADFETGPRRWLRSRIRDLSSLE